MNNHTRTLQHLTRAFLFLLPWQTVWIYQERFINGNKWQYGTMQYFAVELLMWVLIAVFMLWYWKGSRKEGRRKNYSFDWTRDRLFIISCVFFVGYVYFSRLWALDPMSAGQHGLYFVGALLTFFIIWFGPLSLKSICTWISLGSLVPVGLGLWQVAAQYVKPIAWLGVAEHILATPGTSVVVGEQIGRVLRAYGTFSHPNVFGGYLVFAIVASAYVYTRSKIQGAKYKYAFLLVGLVQISALFFTYSRSAWIAFGILFCSFVVYSLFKKNKKRFIPVVFCSLLLAILAFANIDTIKNRFSTTAPHEAASVSERVGGYGEAWGLFKQNYRFGVGIGNYTQAVYMSDKTRNAWEYQPVHNLGLLFLVELGVLGVGLFVLVLWSLVRWILPELKKQWLPAVAVLIAYSAIGFFDHYFLSSFVGVVFTAIIFAATLRHTIFSTDHPRSIHN